MIWLQKKYAKLVFLEGYKEKTSGRHFANFRCPYCGDSKNNKSKKRGWFILRNNNLFFKCYNCDEPSKSFKRFLYEQDRELYNLYIKELFLEERQEDYHEVNEPDIFSNSSNELNLQTCDTLPETHIAVNYLNSRKIDRKHHHKFYYSDNYYNWCKTVCPDEFPSELESDKRVIIPFKSRQGEIFTAIGRTLENNEPKYLTIRIDKDFPKIFGLDTVDVNKTIFVLEGPFDSLFLPNSLAFAGALGNPAKILDYIDVVDKTKLIFIPDNERRNKHSCNYMKKIIDAGFSIFLWPENINVKDINNLVESGYSKLDIMKLIKQNTYHGMKAKVLFANWKK